VEKEMTQINPRASLTTKQISSAAPDTAFFIKNIFHKNREISILTMKKKTARLTLLQEATERTSQGEIQNKTLKTHSGMNESASLTPVQGPSTVACMIVT